MKKRILPAAMMFLVISSPLCAETLILKDGKVVKGQVLEKTGEYVKIDCEGVPLTYYMEDIQSIEETKEAERPGISSELSGVGGEAAVHPYQQNTGSVSGGEWQQWRESVKNYLVTTMLLQGRGYTAVQTLLNEFSKPAVGGKVAVDVEVFKGLASELQDILAEMAKLTQTKEFEAYHAKLLGFFKGLKESVDILKQGNVTSANELAMGALDSYIGSVQELKDIFMCHQAPQEAVAPLEEVIQFHSKLGKNK